MRIHLQPAVQLPDKLCICNIQYINVIFVYIYICECVCVTCAYIQYTCTVYIVNSEVGKANHAGNWKVYNDYIVGGLLVCCSVFS